MNGYIKIRLIANMDGGSAKDIEVPVGAQVYDLFDLNHLRGRPENYHIRVDQQTVTGNVSLREGSRVSVVPKKTEGA